MKIWIHCPGEVANEVSENVEEADLAASGRGGDASECNHGIQVQLSFSDLFFGWIYIFFNMILGSLGGMLYVYLLEVS